MTKLLIEQEYLENIVSIFSKYCPKATILAYGSRLGGNAHSGSDLDLAVKDFGDTNCNISELKEILSQSNIPFLVDILEFNSLSKSFQTEILSNFEVIYPVRTKK